MSRRIVDESQADPLDVLAQRQAELEDASAALVRAQEQAADAWRTYQAWRWERESVLTDMQSTFRDAWRAAFLAEAEAAHKHARALDAFLGALWRVAPAP